MTIGHNDKLKKKQKLTSNLNFLVQNTFSEKISGR